MSELTFIFGPNKTFFFDSPKSWKFHNIPPTLRQLFNSSMSPDWRVAQPFCIALGPQINSPEPIWYCSCRVLNGEEKIFYSQAFFDFNYPDLSRWTKTIPNAARSCFITFGPGLSYFACAQGNGSVWAGVSSELTDKVQKAYDTPSTAALGMDGAWFVMWPDGYFTWKFYGNYGALDKILTEAAPRSVAYVAISPYNKEHYFVSFKDRTVKYNFSGAPEWLPQIQEVFTEWQAEILQKQGYQQPYQPVPPHLQQYLPTPGQPAYVAAHYASAPPQPSPYYSNGALSPPPQFAVELPGDTLALPPATSRPASIAPSSMTASKRRGLFSKLKGSKAAPASSNKRDSIHTANQAANAVSNAGSTAAATSGSQECNVM